MDNNQVILKSLIIVFLLFIIIVGAAYILFPRVFERQLANIPKKRVTYMTSIPQLYVSPNVLQEKNTWKSYSNGRIYSMKYPAELELVSNDSFQDLIMNKSNGSGGSETAIKLHITVNYPIHDFSSLFSARNGSFIKTIGVLSLKKIKNTTVNGNNAVDYLYETKIPGDERNASVTYGTVIKKGSTVVDISGWNNDSSVYFAVLPTFQFIQ